jgi:hypothetical protein
MDAAEFRLPTTALLGSSTQLADLVRRCQEQTGHAWLTGAWPGLLGVLVQRTPGDNSAHDVLVQALDRRVVVVEVMALPQGIFAVEDARHGGLRLIVEGGAYCELIPAEDRAKEAPTRRGIHEAEPGAIYELVTTTASGLWASRTGVGVCFDGREAQRVRFVDLPALPSPAPVILAPASTPQPVMKPVRRPQSAGIPVTQPGTAFRMPWSAPADRG